MKLFYAIQATGNGHISRASEIYPYLKKYGEVDFFLSGNNCNLPTTLPIKYKSKGCSLHYSECGGLNYFDIVKNINPINMLADAKSLPMEKYDIIINDFDFVTSLACRLQKVPSVQLGHQASFQSDKTPRPKKRNALGELVLKKYAVSSNYIGFHFDNYEDFITPPVIKEEFLLADPKDLGHVTIYLPSYQQHCIEEQLYQIKDIEFHWFLKSVTKPNKIKNVHFMPIDQKSFNESLINCHGLITGGGFETPAEALYLHKKLMSIPIQKHYEQECNGAALEKLGVKVLKTIDDQFASEIARWYVQDKQAYTQKANNIEETIQKLIDTYPQKSKIDHEAMLFI